MEITALDIANLIDGKLVADSQDLARLFGYASGKAVAEAINEGTFIIPVPKAHKKRIAVPVTVVARYLNEAADAIQPTPERVPREPSAMPRSGKHSLGSIVAKVARRQQRGS